MLEYLLVSLRNLRKLVPARLGYKGYVTSLAIRQGSISSEYISFEGTYLIFATVGNKRSVFLPFVPLALGRTHTFTNTCFYVLATDGEVYMVVASRTDPSTTLCSRPRNLLVEYPQLFQEH